jgi:HPt (histidine-containing phosphotransfer) domain-containing protein
MIGDSNNGFRGKENVVVFINGAIKNIVPGYLDGMKSTVNVLHAALKDQNYYMIEELAHKMYGSGGSYGFAMISEIGETMEYAASHKENKTIERCIQQLEFYLSHIEIVYE